MADDDTGADAPNDQAAADRAAKDRVPDAEVVEDTPLMPPAEPVRPAVRQRSGTGRFLGLVLGGIVAAGAGFGLARAVPGGWPIADTSALEGRIADLSTELAAQKAALAALADRPVPDGSAEIASLRADLTARLEAIAPPDAGPAIALAIAPLESSLATLDARLTEVEKRPAGPGGGVSAAALAAYDRELQALRDEVARRSGAGDEAAAKIAAVAADATSQIAAAAQEAADLKTAAAAAARSATVGAALGRLRAALDAGGPFAAALADLTAAGLDIPPDLGALAETGIPTLIDLQRRFPDAARAALDKGLRAEVGDSWGARLTGFLRTQTGARSLEPRAGTDPDAILSRAEAAVQDGNLPTALTELSALADPAKAALADWIAAAQAREQARASIDTLAAAADTN